MFYVEVFNFKNDVPENETYLRTHYRSEALSAADSWLRYCSDAAVAIVDCSRPTSTDVRFRTNGYVPLSIDRIIAKRAEEVRRNIFPALTVEGGQS